ncbi:dynein light chain [Echinococcus multilocularis]|uniref:Dynein light chain n=1 Tax=Echinococcus multilocularis TaxID=6211 RepID=A0A068YAZ3_ECHMU|nr:dynein light chain [Echinococcus multilocularis]
MTWNAGSDNITSPHRAHTHTLTASYTLTPGRYLKQKTGYGMNRKENVFDEIAKMDDHNIQLVVRSTDMSEAQQKEAANVIAEALSIHYKEAQVAKMVKAHFDAKCGRAWQCIVGKHFASYVTHEVSTYLLVQVGNVSVMLYKTPC